MIAGIIKQVVSKGARPSLCLISSGNRLTIANCNTAMEVRSWTVSGVWALSSFTSDQLKVCCCGVSKAEHRKSQKM